MATPPSRRPGFSRKAQYGIFAGYVLAVAGALGGLLLLAISLIDPTGFAALRSIGREATAPVAEGVDGGRRAVGGAGSTIAAYVNAGRKNAELQRQVDAYRAELIKARSQEREIERLHQMLGLVQNTAERVAVGRLISTSASSTRRLATLSVGTRRGVRSGQPVRSPKGLVGRILNASAGTATILLITDPENVVPVRRASDGLPAFSTGLADGNVEIRAINAGQNPFRAGDVLVTSGNGGLYAPDIPVAQVLRLTPDGAVARPFAQPADTSYAMVQRVFIPVAPPKAPEAPASDLPADDAAGE
ncbi:rod shape-determining protein MreC [Novosphingopyxis sp. YJ-S2-01]|uniref:rod shape-determining protein MreC n=1 Tax=Novosphingopyxis sp. YJ-S2-01 TaxID=2794021 RepID=UPI0018DB13AA|nr:rod shape-determining protein MreC [Novosphingopyxis sp. YJ-S2-01]MBH9537792.1 rod shape-determining protein MreC [Novosphingopyxis sp. YJ-S2-01]